MKFKIKNLAIIFGALSIFGLAGTSSFLQIKTNKKKEELEKAKKSVSFALAKKFGEVRNLIIWKDKEKFYGTCQIKNNQEIAFIIDKNNKIYFK